MSAWCMSDNGRFVFACADIRDDALEHFQPVVVLSPPDGARAGWPVVLQALREAREKTGLSMIFGGLIEQIEAQTAPPKPDEPTGLGAVVVDESEVEWVHLGSGLWCYGTTDGPSHGFEWAHVHAVRVLSEGVTEGGAS